MPPQKMHVLQIDDDLNILKQAKIFLEKINPEIEITSLADPLQALELLSNTKYDCVITDYKMPQIDGIELSTKIREKHSLPLILYTGHGSEEVAEKAYKAGINDYIRKEVEPSHYQVFAKRIVSAITQYREAERKQYTLKALSTISSINQYLLREKNQEEETILNYVIKLMTRNGVYTHAGLLRFNEGKIVSRYFDSNDSYFKTVFGVISDSNLPKYIDTALKTPTVQVIRDPGVECFNCSYKPANGSSIMLHRMDFEEKILGVLMVEAPQLRCDQEEQTMFEEITRDIASAIQQFATNNALKKSEERYRMLLDSGLDGVAVNTGGKLVYVNESFAKMIGYESSELLGMNTWDLHAPEYVEVVKQNTGKRQRGASAPSRYEVELIRKDGSRLPVEYSVSLIEYEGKKSSLTFIRDITEQVKAREAERARAASDEKFRRFFMNQPVFCYIVSKEGNIVEVNETVLDTLGYTREELIGKPVITTLYSPSSRGKAEQLFRRWLETGEIRNEELNIVTKTGKERTILLNVDAVRSESGEVIQSISVQADITQRKQMEDEARTHYEESKRSALILENVSDSVIVTDLDGVISYWNVGAENIFGYSSEEMIGKNVRLLNLAEERGAVADSQLDKVKRSESYPTEWMGLKKNGSEVWLLLHTKLLKDHEGNQVGMIGVGKEITQRKQAEEQLRESEERYRSLVENSSNAISVTIGDTIVYANQKRADLSGKNDPSELVGTSALSQVAEGDWGTIIKIREARERGEKPPSPLEYRMLSADGSVRDIMDYHSEIKYQGNNAVQHMLNDITEQKRYEKRLEALHRHASDLQLVGNVQQVCELTLDAMEQALDFKDGSFSVVEKGVLKEKGVRGTPILDILLPLDGKGITVKAAREKRSVLVKDTRGDPDFLRGKADSLSELAVPVVVDGETRAVLNLESLQLDAFDEEDQRLVETLAMHVSSAYQRIDESERVERKDAEAAKEHLDNVSRLSGMIRHDLMSPLQVIKNSTYLLRHSPGSVEEMAKTIDDSVDYTVKILDDLRTITTHRELVKNQVDLAELIEQSLAGNVIPQSVKVERIFNGPVNVYADSTSIRRCFDNLIKNAVEAMPQGGVLTTSINVKEKSVELAVKDTGKGLSAEVMKSLFKPFFSTKSSGRGLGLALCKNVVETHGGQITVESKVDEGTTFTVTLPM